MAYDRWSREYHLTPHGWLRGTYTFFGKVQGAPVARPEDAGETWTEECEQASGFFARGPWDFSIVVRPRRTRTRSGPAPATVRGTVRPVAWEGCGKVGP